MERLSRDRARRLPRRRLRGSAASSSTSAPRRRRWSSARCRSAAGPSRRDAGRRRRFAAGDSVGVRVDADAAAAAVVARNRRGAARRARPRRAATLLREMYARWPFFRSTLDLIAMVLAESDARIAAEYDRRLVPPDRCRRRRRSAPPPRRHVAVGADRPRARNGCSPKTRCCGDRSRCGTRTSTRSTWSRSSCSAACARDGEADPHRSPTRSWSRSTASRRGCGIPADAADATRDFAIRDSQSR